MGVKTGAADVCLPHSLVLIRLTLTRQQGFFFFFFLSTAEEQPSNFEKCCKLERTPPGGAVRAKAGRAFAGRRCVTGQEFRKKSTKVRKLDPVSNDFNMQHSKTRKHKWRDCGSSQDWFRKSDLQSTSSPFHSDRNLDLKFPP